MRILSMRLAIKCQVFFTTTFLVVLRLVVFLSHIINFSLELTLNVGLTYKVDDLVQNF